MTSIANAPRQSIPTYQKIGTALVAILSAESYWAWMGWDQTYEVDAATKGEGGPYSEWQVVGCGVSLIVIFFAALLLRVRPLYASAALSVAFSVAWAVGMARVYTDSDAGLVLMMVCGMAGALAWATAAGSGIAFMIRQGYRALRQRWVLSA